MSDDLKTPPIHTEGITPNNDLTQALDDILQSLDASTPENLAFSLETNEQEDELVFNEENSLLELQISDNATEIEETPSEDNDLHNTDWVALASKLREQNRQLIQTVVQLEQSLTQARQEQQEQSRRWRNSDTLLSQQAEELNKTLEQMSVLVHQLEASQAETQRQQLKSKSLTEQIEATQQQMAELEREYTLLHETHQHKIHLLNTAQQDIHELQNRLQRQQRYTLQYKTALDHALGHGNDKNEEIASLTASTTIQPWKSSESDPSEVDPLTPATSTTEPEISSETTARVSEETAQPPETTAMVSEETAQPPETVADMASSSGDESDELSSLSPETVKSPSFNMKHPKHPQLHHSQTDKISAANVIIDLPNFLRNRSS